MTRKGGFYGVRVGRIPGVYRTWQEASDQTSHFPNARHRKFSTYDEARAFVYGAAGEAQPTQTQANPRRPLVHGKPPSVNTAAAAATSSISARRNDLVVIDDDGMDPRPDVHSFLPSPPPPYARDAPQEPVSAAKGVSPNQSSTTTAEHASIVAKPTLSAFSDNAGTDTLTAEQLADPWHSPPITTHRKEHRKTECEFQRDTKREKDLVQERLREAEPLLRLFGINPNETVAPTQTVKTDSLKQEMHPPPSAHVHEQSPSTNLLDSLAILSPEQRELIWNLEKGNNVFLTGSAGTGKSVSLRMAIEYLRMKMKRVGVTAPTGVAAQQVGGVTINSFAKLGSEPFNPAKILSNNIANSENWDGLDVLIIDEISMISHRVLDLVDSISKAVYNSKKPFGGLQVVVCGDFFQLPPVPSAYCNQCLSKEFIKLQPHEAICQNSKCFEKLRREMKPKNTFDPRTLFAFESTVWEKADFVFVELTQVFRQDDKFFVDLLNRIRWGTYTPEDQRLLNACTKPLDTTQHLATRLETHRANADSTNERFFEELPDRDTRDYHALDGVSDSFDSHLLKSIEDYVRAPATVKLRRGTQVMLIANLCVTEGLVNGARGVVIDFDFSKDVHGRKLSEKLYPVVVFKGSIIRTIVEYEFRVEYATNSSMWRVQVPLIFGWAITIHKSQGMTLDQAYIDLRKCFADGQAYVALSRVKTAKGICLERSGPHFASLLSVKTNQRVKKFYLKLQKDKKEKELLAESWKPAMLSGICSFWDLVGPKDNAETELCDFVRWTFKKLRAKMPLESHFESPKDISDNCDDKDFEFEDDEAILGDMIMSSQAQIDMHFSAKRCMKSECSDGEEVLKRVKLE